MTTQWDDRRRGPGGWAVFLALILGALAVGLFVRRAHTGLAGHLAALLVGRPTTVDVSAPVVVDRIQHLSRLESVVYQLDTVVTGERTSAILPDVLAGDKLLLIVHGQTIAGVDLSQLKPENVQITETGNGRSIRVQLPPSQIFVTAVDNDHTRVFSRDTGLLVPADPNLETQTRAQAQTDLTKAALADGILDAASKNARVTVTALLQGLGFQQVEVR